MNKACPVILRTRFGQDEILAFHHPLAGCQLVKGTIEPGEALDVACVRELFEESGLHATVVQTLGTWHTGFQNQVWGICLMRTEADLPEQWIHHCLDDGGHDFRFFWQPIHQPAGDDWHPLFRAALVRIRTLIATA